MMHREEAGMPTAAPRVIRVAEQNKFSPGPLSVRRVLTNIAPDRRPVKGVVGPDHGVDELIEARQCDPDHVVASSGIPRLKVPW